jgi:predicted DNA-binding protein with PD1-like motif
LPIRLPPNADLRRALEDAVAATRWGSAFVVCGIGSLSRAQIRFAGAPDPTAIEADLEIISVGGTISPDGAHLHLSVADADGKVLGGHAAYGCIVRTTAELLLAMSPDWSLAREHDPATGFSELRVQRPAPPFTP